MCAGIVISFTCHNYTFNESDGFATVGIGIQGNISSSERISVRLIGGIIFIQIVGEIRLSCIKVSVVHCRFKFIRGRY